MSSAAVYDTEGPRLTPDEKAFFRDADPWGFIVFADHCANPEATRDLVSELQDCVGRAAPVMIDQEGGRVARMKPPAFPAFPPPGVFGELYRLDPVRARNAARLNARLIGEMVRACGVTINCAPMLDVRQIDSDPVVIGDRALAAHPDIVADLGRSVMEGTLEAGVVPVMKHMPGHGRAICDSHHELPCIEASAADLSAVDFEPFRRLKDCPAGMTGHLFMPAFDDAQPSTLSAAIIREVIRGEIGFGGLLFSDDLLMKALGGPVGDRAGAALRAGCDIALCCNYTLAEKRATAPGVSALAGDALARAEAALAAPPAPAEIDIEAARADLLRLLKPVWSPPDGIA